MRVFVEYNEPTGPISGFGLGDGTPGGSYYRKTCFFAFFLVRCIRCTTHNASQRARENAPLVLLSSALKSSGATRARSLCFIAIDMRPGGEGSDDYFGGKGLL